MNIMSSTRQCISANDQVDEATGNAHRAKALEQLISAPLTTPEPATKSNESRRRRRRAAGQSGGEFEITRGITGPRYRYVWPDQRENLVDQLVALTRKSSVELLSANESDLDDSSTTPVSRQGARSGRPGERNPTQSTK